MKLNELDFDELKERLEKVMARQLRGESLPDTWERQRKCSFKNPEFWKLVSWAFRKLVFAASSRNELNLTYAFSYIVSSAKAGTIQEVFYRFAVFTTIVETLGREFYRGPPKGFIPLPDAEIGGCARNDSLIAPAI